MRFSPSSSWRPRPTARTRPFCGFSFAVSGRTMPLAVVSSSSIARTISRSPRGLSFICKDLRRERVVRTPVGTRRCRVPISGRQYRTSGAAGKADWHSAYTSANERSGERLVLRAADAQPRVGDVRRVLDDLREAHDGDDVLHRHLAPVDLLEEVDHLVVAAELGVVVLDVPRRQVLDPLDVDLVDDRIEDLLARRVLIADRPQHGLVLLVLVRLVAEAVRRRLAPPLELVGEDRRVEVQDLHGGQHPTEVFPCVTEPPPPFRARPCRSVRAPPPRAPSTPRAPPRGRGRRALR